MQQNSRGTNNKCICDIKQVSKYSYRSSNSLVILGIYCNVK